MVSDKFHKLYYLSLLLLELFQLDFHRELLQLTRYNPAHNVRQRSPPKLSNEKELDFEASLSELESLVERMEKGELSLEDALKDFERGVELTRDCQLALNRAEQKVQQLVDEDGQIQLIPFESDE